SPTLPTARVSYPESALEDDPHTALPAKGANLVGDKRLPSLEALAGLHWQNGANFASPETLGYIKKRKEAAGFDPHKFRYPPYLAGLPTLNQPDLKPKDQPKERWALKRLELVSLLKHERPVVYVSAQLPRMEDLKNAPTRDLDGFEAAGLKQLEAGEEIV